MCFWETVSCKEGLVWEAAMSAGHYKLDNMVAFIDWNGLQIDGNNDDVMTVFLLIRNLPALDGMF